MALEAPSPPEKQLSVLQANINRMADEFEQQLQESRAHMEVCPCCMSSKLPMQQPASMLWKAKFACPAEAEGPACAVLIGEQHGLGCDSCQPALNAKVVTAHIPAALWTHCCP